MAKKVRARQHKKQHYVPRCYTKAWHDPLAEVGPHATPYVWVFDKDGSNPRRKAPGNLFTETDIYTIERPGGERDLYLEHGLQQLEDQFTRVRELTFNRRVWPSADQFAWIFGFVAAAKVRTATHRDFHRGQWGGIRQRMEEMREEVGRASPEQKAAMARMGRLGAVGDVGERMTIEDVRAIEEQPIQRTIGPMVAAAMAMFPRMSAMVLCADDPIGFVTSDNPCTWHDPVAYRLQPIFRSPSLASQTIEVTMPISPELCLMITHDSRGQGFVEASREMVDELNRRHVFHCEASFVSRSEETRAIWFEPGVMPDDAWEARQAMREAQAPQRASPAS